MMSEQQDAHEFFNVLFAAIEEEKDHHKSRLGISIDDAPSSRLNSISPFRGYLASQLNCLTCSYKVGIWSKARFFIILQMYFYTGSCSL